MSPRRLSSANFTTIIVTIIVTVGTITTAYFAFRGGIATIELPLEATQTAAAKITDVPNPSPFATQAKTDTANPPIAETFQATLAPTQTTISLESTPIVLFSDNFDTNANGWALGDRDGKVTKQNREIIDGTLQFDVFFYQDGAYGWVNLPNFRAENFYISVDVEVVQFSTRSEIGIIFPFRITNSGNTSYAVEFNNDGTFALYSTQTLTQDGRWKLIHQENSNLLQLSEGTVNNFSIRVLGQRFTAFINNIELFTFEDNTIRGVGDIGIGVTGEGQKSAIVRFDNLVITK